MALAFSILFAVLAMACLLGGEWKLGIVFVVLTITIQSYYGFGDANNVHDDCTNYVSRGTTC
jgi:hypothetical protein